MFWRIQEGAKLSGPLTKDEYGIKRGLIVAVSTLTGEKAFGVGSEYDEDCESFDEEGPCLELDYTPDEVRWVLKAILEGKHTRSYELEEDESNVDFSEEWEYKPGQFLSWGCVWLEGTPLRNWVRYIKENVLHPDVD